MHAKSLQSCPTLWNPVDCSPPGSSVHGILQARILEWVIMPYSKESSQPRHQTQDSGLIPGSGRHPGEWNGSPLQYSCLENPRDRGAWRATVHRVTKSRTWQSNLARMRVLTHYAPSSTPTSPLRNLDLIGVVCRLGCQDFFEAPYVSLNVSQGENHWGNG